METDSELENFDARTAESISEFVVDRLESASKKIQSGQLRDQDWSVSQTTRKGHLVKAT